MGIRPADKCSKFQLCGLFFSSGNQKQCFYIKKEIRKIKYFFQQLNLL